MRLHRPLEATHACDVFCITKQKVFIARLDFCKRRQNSTRMIKMKVRKDYKIDVIRGDANGCKICDKTMIFFADAITFRHAWIKKSSNSSLAQDQFIARLPGYAHQHGPACQLDTTNGIRLDPFFPNRTRDVSEHGPTVQPLAITLDCGDGDGDVWNCCVCRRRRRRRKLRGFHNQTSSEIAQPAR